MRRQGQARPELGRPSSARRRSPAARWPSSPAGSAASAGCGSTGSGSGGDRLGAPRPRTAARTRRGPRPLGRSPARLAEDRLHDLVQRVLTRDRPRRAAARRPAERAAITDAGLRARPLERLLDLGPRRVRELGRLVARLLEQPCAARLGLAELLRGVAVARSASSCARLVAGRVQDLGALALALGAVALELGLALLQLALAPPDLLLGAPQLRGGRASARRARARRRTRRRRGSGGARPSAPRGRSARPPPSGRRPGARAAAPGAAATWRRKASKASRTAFAVVAVPARGQSRRSTAASVSGARPARAAPVLPSSCCLLRATYARKYDACIGRSRHGFSPAYARSPRRIPRRACAQLLDAYPELAQLFLRARPLGAPRHRVDAGLVLRERDRVAEVRLVARAPSPSGRCRTRSRRAAARPSRARRAGTRTSRAAPRGVDLQQVEHLRLQLRLVDPERPAAELVAVADEVVRDARSRAPGSVSKRSTHSAVGRVNGWCDAPPALLVLVPLEHREVGDPEPTPRVARRSARARRPSCEAQRAEHARRLLAAVGARRARVVPGSLGTPRARPRRGTSRSASAPRRPRRRRGTRAPSRPTASRTPRARRARARENSCGTRRKRTASAPREDAELRAARHLGRVLDLEPEAQVGLVGAEAAVGLGVGHAAGTASRARRRRTRARPSDIIRSISAKRNSWSGNAISTSSCVISWTRSARRSSSRKQIAIW